MRKLLVTGGTVFVSRYVAEYYAKKGDEVYVLNRNHHPQPEGTTLIEADRRDPGDVLKSHDFDAVLDITAYNGADIAGLLGGLGHFGTYIMISSSAVYPETAKQPFSESETPGVNTYWGAYGTDKIEAEQELQKRVPEAYILRPPYLYGPMNNVYREAFVFECADKDRAFYVPRDGEMGLQFFHVRDLCRFMDILLEKKPAQHVFNVGNDEMVSIADWVTACYNAAGKTPELIPVREPVEQRNYFSFYDYEYRLDVSAQKQWMPDTMLLADGLKEAYEWYQTHADCVRRKDFIYYIDEHFV